MIREIDEKSKLKFELGQTIKDIRKSNVMSQRELAREIELSNSNLKYIEDGVNAPSPEVYTKLIEVLKPNDKDRAEMDNLYSEIRGTPPPDICAFLIENAALYSAIRNNKTKLCDEQIEMIGSIISRKI